MHIEHQKSLQAYNTFGIDVTASSYIRVTDSKQLEEVVKAYKDQNIFILNGGSNMLLTADIDALVIHIAICGITEKKVDDNTILVSAGAGENWHKFVLYCISKNYGGLENLALIPGNVGSAPIQNIGAYGVELKDTFHSCTALDITTGKERKFNKEECEFGYRESIFKGIAKGRYIITEVSFLLTTHMHQLHTTYGAIQKELGAITTPTIKQIADAVIAIRKSKLPDPKQIGNGGSFFKNPVVSKTVLSAIQEKYEEVPFYELDENMVKLPAGWLIEKAGFKGKRWKDAGVHKNQALVLVNYGNATGNEILAIAQKIQQQVKKQFNISLQTEVNII
ncbi:UDP-N-acetylmuramate dehydrogenase [Aquimarina sp. ERC-38]|uniref:UDP-N-acetylmuramate dehydrogenase n=1 Tax=Aquimarina sp. ERC-38 TaxID=2949996 RepID=UPI00224540B4|nr:UDP-N-acetylmuramate dehydrogenase [Aquimarina sp. ERC-38]UZO80571.1 UDP-N-acetylmuramate dehydrogenase [Aquimarina sp. ERC-38]